jgi:Peptidase family M48
MSRNIVFAAATAAMLGASGTVAASNEDPLTHPSARAALQYFESALNAGFLPFRNQLRRPAPSSNFRAKVMRDLPQEGELAPTAQEAVKLAIIPLVLAFHGREDDIEVRLVAGDGLAFAGLHARTVLLISREALERLDRDELMAVVAHELGHDYVWNEYEEAQKAGRPTPVAGTRIAVRWDCGHHDGAAASGHSETGLSRHHAAPSQPARLRENRQWALRAPTSTCPVHSCHGQADRTLRHSTISLKRRPKGQRFSYGPGRVPEARARGSPRVM